MFYVKIPLSFMNEAKGIQESFLRTLRENGTIASFAISLEDLEAAEILEDEEEKTNGR